MSQKRIQNCDTSSEIRTQISDVRNMQHSSDMVERVARALFALDAPNGDPDELAFHPHSDLQTPKWKLYERQAVAALEASHHAELVTERDAYRIAYEEDEDKIEELAEALTKLLAATNPQQHRFAPVFLGEAQEQARSVLAKIGGEA